MPSLTKKECWGSAIKDNCSSESFIRFVNNNYSLTHFQFTGREEEIYRLTHNHKNSRNARAVEREFQAMAANFETLVG